MTEQRPTWQCSECGTRWERFWHHNAIPFWRRTPDQPNEGIVAVNGTGANGLPWARPVPGRDGGEPLDPSDDYRRGFQKGWAASRHAALVAMDVFAPEAPESDPADCPICTQTFEDGPAMAAHLAEMHGGELDSFVHDLAVGLEEESHG